ncbi:acyltransferase family protein [Rouxiella sp. WC2420]|uniref:Acyltransferase family protein n=1 Tax=Rouxiella sp. WC2420 TaxID=3234145 RepID=A0AB39VYF2_9GAMM
MKSKIESLQVLRAFAAVFVVVNHLWGEYDTTITQSLGLNIIGNFGVDAFFILSGFIMCYKTREDSRLGLSTGIDFLKKRIERIYPIFLIILIPFMLLYLKQTHPARIYEIIGNIFLLPSFTSNPSYHMLIGPSWSLVYEMFFYIIYAVVMMLVRNKKQLVIFSVGFLVLMVVTIDGFSLQGPELGASNFSYMIGDPLMINFAMGCLYAQCFNKLHQVKISIPLATIMILAFFILGMWLNEKGIARFVSFGLPAMAIVIIFSLMDASGSRSYRLLVYLGNASYSIYITHFFTQVCALILFSHMNINHDLYGIIFSMVSVIAACIFYSLIEKRIILAFQKRSLHQRVPKDVIQ